MDVSLKTIKVGDRVRYTKDNYVNNILEIIEITQTTVTIVATNAPGLYSSWPVGYKYSYNVNKFALESRDMVFVSRAKPDTNFKRQLGLRWSHAK